MLNILWDASHIWGYLVLHAVRSAGLSCRLLNGSDIAQGGLSGKVLVVPGGAGRRKARALGAAGKEAILRFVAEGGHYLGLCGGAGLALADGLGLCPWRRATLPDRVQLLVSGHIRCAVPECVQTHALVPSGLHEPMLPVWWPGRFEERADDNVMVLARYREAGPDLHMSDLPYGTLPAHVLEAWDKRGISPRPSLLDGQPCIISGEYGKGSWVLSYSHLETPEDSSSSPENLSRDAGRWFFHLLQVWGEQKTKNKHTDSLCVPPWPSAPGIRWEDPILLSALNTVNRLEELALCLGLLFPRNSWLLGWRAGVPGGQFNNLRMAVHESLNLSPTPSRQKLWKELAPAFARDLARFDHEAEHWLLTRRLADTLAEANPDRVPGEELRQERTELFGTPMDSGGLCGRLVDDLEALLTT